MTTFEAAIRDEIPFGVLCGSTGVLYRPASIPDWFEASRKEFTYTSLCCVQATALCFRLVIKIFYLFITNHMKEDAEINIIKDIQALPGKYKSFVTKIMRLFSLSVHHKFFMIIILVMFHLKKISLLQVLFLGTSQFILFTIKYIVKRKRPYDCNKDIELLETFKANKNIPLNNIQALHRSSII